MRSPVTITEFSSLCVRMQDRRTLTINGKCLLWEWTLCIGRAHHNKNKLGLAFHYTDFRKRRPKRQNRKPLVFLERMTGKND